MEYVHVASKSTPIPGRADYTSATVGQVNICLYSLIGGLKQKRFGLDTLIGVAEDIEEFKSLYLTQNRKDILIDSGGYSVIVQDVRGKRHYEIH